MFVVLIQSRLGLRDAFFVNGDNAVEAMKEASDIMIRENIHPSVVTVLPAKESRFLSYLFPKDVKTDATLIRDFLLGNVRTVRMSYELTERLEKEGNAEAEQGTEQAAEECQQDMLLLQRMRRFLHEDADE